MSVVLPDWAATMLDLIGVSWPNVDEDDYRHTADSLRDFAHDLDDNTGAANQHMQRLLASGRGQSMEALSAHWGKVKDKHLKDLAGASRVIAGALDLAADAITAQKGEAITQLGYLADETGIALALIPETGGLSALLDAGAIEATQQVVKQLFKEVAKDAVRYIVSALTEPAVAALDGMAVDLAIQLGADALGLQDGVNLNETKQAGKEGFHQGVGSAKTALHLDSVGGGDGGGGGGGLDDVLIDHAEHERASTHLNVVGASVHGKTRGQIFKARGHLGRTRGRGSIAAAIEPVADKAVNALEKAATELADHIKDRLPKAVQQISKDFRKADQDVKDGFKKLDKHHGKNGDFHLDAKERTRQSSYSKPDSLREAKSDPRRHGIPLNGKTCKGDPVDVATGEMTLPQTDLSLPGVLPLVLRRTHLSEYRYGQWFGRSWASTLDERIEFDTLGIGAVWAREDGSLLVYPRLPQPGGEPVLPLEGPRLPLAHGGADNAETVYQVSDPYTGLTRSFTGSPYNQSTAYWLTEVTDRNSNRITIDRHSDGTPTAVTHDGGYAVQLSASDARIRTLDLRTPDGPVTVMSYGYDTTGNLNEVTNSCGLPLRFTYDSDGRITSWADRNDSTFTYVYDAAGRVVRTVGAEGYLSSSFTYDTENRVTLYTDSTGATTAFELNERLQVVATTDALGHTTRTEYDEYDRVLSSTDPLGHTSRVCYDEDGWPTELIRADGRRTSVTYNALGLPASLTEPDGATWHHTYDAQGNRTAVTDPAGATTRYTYDGRGAITSVTDAVGLSVRITCNDAGLPLSVTDPVGATTLHRYDAFGRTTEVINPLGGSTLLSWSVEGLLTSRTNPNGASEQWSFDGEGNCTSHTDPLGQVTGFEYGHFDLPTSRVTPDGVRHTYSHDTELRLTKVTNSQGLTWCYAYDAAGRLTSETDFDGHTHSYTYDAGDQLVARLNALGQHTTYRYDSVGDLVEKTVDGHVITYHNDPCGRLMHAAGPDAALEYRYDAAGRVVAETVNGRTLATECDAAGRRTLRTTPTGAITTYGYDAVGHRASLTASGRTLAFERNAMGRETLRRFGETFLLTHDWDPAGLLTQQTLNTPHEADPLVHRRYTYRRDGRLTGITDRRTGHRAFTLDMVGRVTAVTATDWSETYAYDQAGNQTHATWPDQHPNAEARGERAYTGTRITRAGRLRYEYDAQGRVILRQKTRLSRKPDTWRYTWPHLHHHPGRHPVAVLVRPSRPSDRQATPHGRRCRGR